MPDVPILIREAQDKAERLCALAVEQTPAAYQSFITLIEQRRQAPDLWTPCDGQRSGVLIIGTRRGDVFVATQVLISADTLGDEAAIRAWLTQHDIHVAPPRSNTASAHKGSPRGDRLMTGPGGDLRTPGRTLTRDDHRAG